MGAERGSPASNERERIIPGSNPEWADHSALGSRHAACETMATFTTTRRVEFGDTDMAGIMHFSNFFRFMEAAETDFLHTLGLSVSWRADGVKWGFPRVSVGCDFQKPARFEDVLTIAVVIERVGTKSVSYRFDFHNQRGEPVAVGRITAVLCRGIAPEGLESVEIPADIRAKLLASGAQGDALV